MAQLGVITNNPTAVFQRTVIEGIRQVAESQNYQLIVETYNSPLKPARVFAPDIEGVLVISSVLYDETLRRAYQLGKPISLISHQVPDIPIPVVMSNNAQGILALVDHLVNRCGRRELVFVRGLMNQIDAQEREMAFRQAIIRHKLRVPDARFLHGDFTPEIAADSMQKLLLRDRNFDAVVVSDYMMAIAVINVLRKAGIDVPGQVSVVSFGDDLVAETAGLTTVAASISELGRCAARQLIAQIKGMHISGVTLLSVELVIRAT